MSHRIGLKLLAIAMLALAGPTHSTTESAAPRPPIIFLAQADDDREKLGACFSCCQQRLDECRKKEGSLSQKCEVLVANCSNHCHSRGETPVDWACWGK